jgi:CHRD domain
MRGSFAVVAGLVLVAVCTDPAPTETPGGARAFSPSLAVGAENAGFVALNTQLRAENERPTPADSRSKGHAHLKAIADGPIESHLKINNTDGETVLFCHIHVITMTNGNGPVVWFLTPRTVRANLAHFEFRQNADYNTSAPFANEDAARAAFDADASRFYVNCHSTKTPAGFIRGDLR